MRGARSIGASTGAGGGVYDMPSRALCGHNIVVMVTENDSFHKPLNSQFIMQTKNFSTRNKYAYKSPSIEMVCVAVEGGFELSNNQEPSPWEDMYSLWY